MNPLGQQINIPGSPSNTLVPTQNPTSSAPTSSNALTSGIVPTFGANTGGGYSSSLNLGMPGGAAGATNVSTAAASPIGGMNLMSSKDLSRMFDSLKKTYGDGTAHALMNFLTTGAGFNQQAIQNMLASLQPGIERGTESLMEQFGTSGNRFGSGAQIGLGDFLSQVNLNEGQIISQMYEKSVGDYINTLMGVGNTGAQVKANSPSIWDKIGGALDLGTSLIPGVSALKGVFGGGGSGGGGSASAGGDIVSGGWSDSSGLLDAIASAGGIFS